MNNRLSNSISLIRIIGMFGIVSINYLVHFYPEYYKIDYLTAINNRELFISSLDSGTLFDKYSVLTAFSGISGVVMLAILSGFCLWMSFELSGRFNFGKYVISRVSRTYVPYLIAVFVSLIAGYFLLNIKFTNYAAAALFAGAVKYNVNAYDFNPPFWYITMLIGCYILFPLLVHIFSKFKICGVIIFTAIIWIIYFLIRLPFNMTYIDKDPLYPIMPFFTMFSIGVIAGYYAFRYKNKLTLLSIIALPVSLALVIWMAFVEPHTRTDWSLNNLYWFGIICTILFGSIGYLLPVKWHKWLMWLSRGTIAVFLYHFLLVPILTEYITAIDSIGIALIAIYGVLLIAGSLFQPVIDNTIGKYVKDTLGKDVVRINNN